MHYIKENDFLKLKQQIENISKMLSGLIKYLNKIKA
ncbi:MAG: hypothetical protein NWQ38_00800 [Cellulophaga sp.]|nr:hypothetical protein [Cellulophaga sp.]